MGLRAGHAAIYDVRRRWNRLTPSIVLLSPEAEHTPLFLEQFFADGLMQIMHHYKGMGGYNSS